MCLEYGVFKVRCRFLITIRNLIDSSACDSRLALNSVSCFETILHARTQSPHAYALAIATRMKFYSGFYFRYRREIYQGSFWYAGVLGVTNLYTIRFCAQLIPSWINTEITLCGAQLSLRAFFRVGTIFAIS